ncbi:hypothetical protein BHM03_00031718 [Ensete ventricosum]|uniref:Uncharacterized protein n=1 Tax=Ensete ventricosum TaxID=4639 RepID=A0A445MIF2_ENSVE|nr:hypothetical protein BHM03_00031718 [Ensete ventricosum]
MVATSTFLAHRTGASNTAVSSPSSNATSKRFTSLNSNEKDGFGREKGWLRSTACSSGALWRKGFDRKAASSRSTSKELKPERCMGFYSNSYEASVPEILIVPIVYHAVVLRRSLCGPCGARELIQPDNGSGIDSSRGSKIDSTKQELGSLPWRLCRGVISDVNFGDLVEGPISGTNPGDLVERVISGTNPRDLTERVISGANLRDLVEG